MKQHQTLVVIGGGAAGFFCAVNAARMHPGLKVFIVEKTTKILSKVKVSGGGRCNVTNGCRDMHQMSTGYPRGGAFLRKAFHHFFTSDTVRWFEERGLKLKTEPDGRMFPVSDSSQSVINCLLSEAAKYGVEILYNREVQTFARETDLWKLKFKNNDSLEVDFVCVASGGFQRSEQLSWLQGTGHTIVNPVPSLFTFNLPGNPINQLMGIVVTEATVKIQSLKYKETGPLLITHWGLSGPVILRLSAWAARELNQLDYQFTILVNWLPAMDIDQLKEKLQQARLHQGSMKIYNSNFFKLPVRLWHFLLSNAGVDADCRIADMTSRSQQQLIRDLLQCSFNVSGKTTFKEEFVTAGGVALQEINHLTMESKLQSNLFFAGEVMDVDGITGGYNFQHAWTSGFIAATAIAQKCRALVN
ncbi:MAG: NAD(P)/FAD-dependent oxidoreductase [Lacibacter sp.]